MKKNINNHKWLDIFFFLLCSNLSFLFLNIIILNKTSLVLFGTKTKLESYSALPHIYFKNKCYKFCSWIKNIFLKCTKLKVFKSLVACTQLFRCIFKIDNEGKGWKFSSSIPYKYTEEGARIESLEIITVCFIYS